MTLARAPDALRQLATDMNVVNNFAFQPHRRLIPWVEGASTPPQLFVGGQAYAATPLLTLCNCYVSEFTAALACPIPPLKANDQLEKFLLANEGKMAGWVELVADPATLTDARGLAVVRASLGYPTVVVAVDSPHGHIAMLMPPPPTDPKGAYVSAAGAHNFVYDRLERSFGVLASRCRFFTHQ